MSAPVRTTALPEEERPEMGVASSWASQAQRRVRMSEADVSEARARAHVVGPALKQPVKSPSMTASASTILVSHPLGFDVSITVECILFLGLARATCIRK